jgi:predicted DNA-binding protein (UPF0251 family)
LTTYLSGDALGRSGLSRKDVYERAGERAGVSKETLRRALGGCSGRFTTQKVADALGEGLELSRGEREVIQKWLVTALQKNL